MNNNLYLVPKEGTYKLKTHLSSQGFNEEEAKEIQFLFERSKQFRLFGQLFGIGVSGYFINRYFSQAKIYRKKTDVVFSLISFPLVSLLSGYIG
jgi:hypothetical protein